MIGASAVFKVMRKHIDIGLPGNPRIPIRSYV